MSKEYKHLQKQLKSLLQRIQTQSKNKKNKNDDDASDPIPVDEASTAIGKQLAYIFISIYLDLESSDTSKSKSKSKSNHDRNRDGENDRNRDWWRTQGYDMIHIIGAGGVNPGVASGFFHALSLDERLLLLGIKSDGDVNHNDNENDNVANDDDFIHWWLKCISIYEEDGTNGNSPSIQALQSCIQGYVTFSARKAVLSMSADPSAPHDPYNNNDNNNHHHQLVTDGSNDPFHLANLYHKCRWKRTRQYLVRECIHAAFHVHVPVQSRRRRPGTTTVPIQATMEFLSPLFYITVVSSSMSSTDQCQMASLCLSLIMQESRLLILRNMDDHGLEEYMGWLVIGLKRFFAPPVSTLRTKEDVLAIGYDFMVHLCELCIPVLLQRGDVGFDGKSQSCGFVMDALNVICGVVLPKMVQCGEEGCTAVVPSLQRVLQLIVTILSLCPSSDEGIRIRTGTGITTFTVYNMGTMCLSMHHEADVALMLKIICLSMKNTSFRVSSHRMIRGVLCSLGFVFRSVNICAFAARDLLKIVDEAEQVHEDEEKEVDCPNNHVFDLASTKRMAGDFLDPLIRYENKFDAVATISNQCESLLLALSMVCISTFENTEVPEKVYSFLKAIIGKHPYLGRRSLPVLVAALERFIASGESKKILPHLEFICSSVAQDSSCAHEIWSILSSMTSPSAPVRIQSMAVRLYPILCISNKRLYSRVYQSLEGFASHPNVTLRLAAAATICDLAKDDLIRDVTDVIGAVQNFLQDEEILVVYFAVLTLHHLIVAEELDYSMVIKVLNNKLVQVGDAHAILKLPDIVIKAVVILMGNGEEETDESSDENDEDDDESDHGDIYVSQQVQASTSGLRRLAIILSESIVKKNEDQDNRFDIETTSDLLSSVYESLLKYSFNSIGVLSLDTEEYIDMKKIVELAYEIAESNTVHKDDCNTHAILLARRVVLFEEDTLGPLLWKVSNRPSKKREVRELSSAFEAIPKVNEGTLTDYLVKKIVESDEIGQLASMKNAFDCLKVLSLPIEFVGVMAKVLDGNEKSEEVKTCTEPCINTLIAQLAIERRSAVERREYLKLYVSLSTIPPQMYFNNLWVQAPQILSSFGDIALQLTTTDATDCLPKLWSNCADKLSTKDGIKYAIAFLKAVYSILDQPRSKKVSPTLVKAIHQSLITIIFPSVCESYREPRIGCVQVELYKCMCKIPRDELMDHNILKFGKAKGADICRVQLIAHLQNAGIFQRRDPYLLRAALWIGKQDGTVKDDVPHFWKASCQLASSASTISMDAKKDFVNTIFEMMLINGVNSLALQVLLQCAVVWGKDATLLYQFIVEFGLSDRIDVLLETIIDLQLYGQQIGNLSAVIDVPSDMMKTSLSLLKETLLHPLGKDKLLVSNCLASVFLSLKNHEGTLELQHALASTSLSLRN